MLHIEIICVGKLKEDYLKSAILEYSKRLSKYCNCNIIELPDEKLPVPLSEENKRKVIEKESNCIFDHIKESSYVIALDLKGKQYSSEEFSEKISHIATHKNSTITFLIGGTLGMSQKLLDSANELICFSKMTFPHQLIRVFLLEQLFRSFKIQNNETYHR
ncbi:MAG: 23S rRNA (pseudouridine(1915)-N(3))-methyltransferase RlmH [Clostridia bacterium]|nr:23S rRNA (pseudouridine(1915)-N(3))-methyltransferase RlmH [Clostridia bacterium]